MRDDAFHSQIKDGIFKYHSRSCYSTYLKKAGRYKLQENIIEMSADVPATSMDPETMSPRIKRRKPPGESCKLCIVCNQISCRGDYKLSRICSFKCLQFKHG